MLKQKLNGVSETLLIPLWARGVETKRSNPIIKDYQALEILDKIDYDFEKFKEAWISQVGVSIRTEILDNATKEFIKKHPNAVIINIGSGLDTRFSRVDNKKIRWYDLDLPEAIAIRKEFFKDNERYKMIAKSVFEYSWISDLGEIKEPVLIIAEGILMFFSEKEVKSLFNKLALSFPNGEMLFEMMTPTIVEMSKQHDTLSKIDGVEFKWGITSGKETLKYNKNIKFLNEWNYFDFHQYRWGDFGVQASKDISFKNKFNNRIVHLKFLS